jgi:hypothetical protein
MLIGLLIWVSAVCQGADMPNASSCVEKQITTNACNHILTNTGVWSPDSRWIVYDIRSDLAGSVFDGTRIEKVNVETGEVKVLYESRHGAHCGVVTHHPREDKVVFILGPENPTPDWQYGPSHRQGVIVAADISPRKKTGRVLTNAATSLANLDARDLTPPFTPGALRGGSHVHVWDAAGEWVSFTYNDALVESDIRDVGVCVPPSRSRRKEARNDANAQSLLTSAPTGMVRVKKDHPRNHDGEFYSVLVTRTTANPRPGSDEIKRACEEGWIGTNGYVRADGTRQRRALAFQGTVVTADGRTISEVFVADLPDDLTTADPGTTSRRPAPPKGVVQRRLTFTADHKSPGLQGPRHWLRSSPDGSRIAFLMKDDNGVVQLWTVSPNGGPPAQVTRNAWDIASAFSWSPDGKLIAHAMDNSIFITDVASGQSTRLTPRSSDDEAPRPEACVFSPDGRKIAFVRTVKTRGVARNQVLVVSWK